MSSGTKRQFDRALHAPEGRQRLLLAPQRLQRVPLCRGAWARVTIGLFRRVALQTIYGVGHPLMTKHCVPRPTCTRSAQKSFSMSLVRRWWIASTVWPENIMCVSPFDHCPGRAPPRSAVKPPAPPHKSATHKYRSTMRNADGGLATPGRGARTVWVKCRPTGHSFTSMLSARAGNRRFRPLSALRAHTKAPYSTNSP
jgi:hypothetical protein